MTLNWDYLAGIGADLPPACLKDSWSDRARLGQRGGQFDGSKVSGSYPKQMSRTSGATLEPGLPDGIAPRPYC